MRVKRDNWRYKIAKQSSTLDEDFLPNLHPILEHRLSLKNPLQNNEADQQMLDFDSSVFGYCEHCVVGSERGISRSNCICANKMGETTHGL